MFPVDSLPASYYEEREATEAAKRLQRIREQQAKVQQAALASAQSNSQQLPQTSLSLSQPPMSRPASSSVLGTIFQGFVRANGQSPSPPPGQEQFSNSGTSTPVLTTRSTKIMTQAEIESMLAERRKDADIVGFRAW